MTTPAHPGRTLFVTLPVADVQRSTAFFTQLGFTFDPRFTDGPAACMLVGEHASVMLGSPMPPAPAGTPYAPAPPAPPAPRRRRSRWLTIGLPLGLLLVAGIVVGVHAVARSIAPAQQAATSYARALVDGRWDDAQGQLCSADRSTVTAQALAQHYATPDLTGYRLDAVDVVTTNGRTSGEARFSFTTADGLETSTVLPLADEHGTWRPCP